MNPFISRTVVGAPESSEQVDEHLLDGQQRLTALWRSLTDNYQVAQVEAGTQMSLHDLVSDLKATASEVAAYIKPSDLMLSVSALLQSKAPTHGSFLSKGFSDDLVKNWETTKTGIKKAIHFLEQERILDAKRLSTDVIVAPLAALWGIAPEGLDAEGEARILLRRYLWRACFTERYERASATRVLADFRELKDILKGHADAKPLIFNEQDWPLPSVEQFINAGWPTRKDRLPRSIICLSLRAGGDDLADGGPATRNQLAQREYHHLFPVARLKEQGKDDREIYKALNCALVTWRTNRNISAKTPERYLAERRKGTSLGEEEVRRRLESHLVPYDEMVTGGYEHFLLARAKRMGAIMIKPCSGESV